GPRREREHVGRLERNAERVDEGLADLGLGHEPSELGADLELLERQVAALGPEAPKARLLVARRAAAHQLVGAQQGNRGHSALRSAPSSAPTSPLGRIPIRFSSASRGSAARAKALRSLDASSGPPGRTRLTPAASSKARKIAAPGA